MEKTKFKKGDIVYWQELQGVVINTDSTSKFPVIVLFKNNSMELTFTNDGRLYSYTPPVLSHTPYTLNGFIQNEVIEKDTLVWVWDNNDIVWQQMFYSHFKDGKHYCFTNQQTSKESNDTIAWDFLETTNPLIK
jgi:hypothetical protein